jgi:hypothetical protein
MLQDSSVPAGNVVLILGASFTALAQQSAPSADRASGTGSSGIAGSPGTASNSGTPGSPGAPATPAAAPSLGSLARDYGGITGNANCQTDAGAFAP